MKTKCTYFVFMGLVLLLLSACRTGYSLADSQIPEIIYHDTVRVQHERLDSIYIHDSIYVRQQADTIYITRNHIQYQQKIIYRDSIKTQRDSIPYPVIVEKKVPYTPRWKNALALAGAIMILFGILYVIISLRK